jgi:hypothetical protein
VEYGDAAIAADIADAHVISHAFPHTYGQPLAHFLTKTANVPDASIITEHPVVRYTHLPRSAFFLSVSLCNFFPYNLRLQFQMPYFPIYFCSSMYTLI